jgi:hypothetical protein
LNQVLPHVAGYVLDPIRESCHVSELDSKLALRRVCLGLVSVVHCTANRLRELAGWLPLFIEAMR